MTEKDYEMLARVLFSELEQLGKKLETLVKIYRIKLDNMEKQGETK